MELLTLCGWTAGNAQDNKETSYQINEINTASSVGFIDVNELPKFVVKVLQKAR